MCIFWSFKLLCTSKVCVWSKKIFGYVTSACNDHNLADYFFNSMNKLKLWTFTVLFISILQCRYFVWLLIPFGYIPLLTILTDVTEYTICRSNLPPRIYVVWICGCTPVSKKVCSSVAIYCILSCIIFKGWRLVLSVYPMQVPTKLSLALQKKYRC